MKLRDIFNRVAAIMETQSRNCSEDAIDFLETQGFKYLSSGCFSSAYSHSMHGGIVIKISDNRVDRPDLAQYPFLRPIWLKPLFATRYVMVQPLAQTDFDSKIKAFVHIKNFVSNHPKSDPDTSYDMHVKNVGMFRGRAISFDINTNSSNTWYSESAVRRWA